jgi:hypothetical protein
MKTKEVVLAVGGIPVAFRVRCVTMHAAIVRRYRGYLCGHDRRAVVIECVFSRKISLGGERVDVRRAGKCGWEVRRRDFRVSWEGTCGRAVMYRSIYAFDGMLRVLLSMRAVCRGRLFLHASAVKAGNRAYVFPGKSGSGKTTISRLAAETCVVLNDEIVCIGCARSGHARVWATPFWGEMGCGPVHENPVGVRAIMFLKKCRSSTSLQPIDKIHAASKLLRAVCVFGKDREVAEMVFDAVGRIVGEVSCFTFVFQKNAERVCGVLAGD